MDEHRKAVWLLALALVMFFTFTILPVLLITGFNPRVSLMATVTADVIFCPLIAWRLVELLAGDGSGLYHSWEIEQLIKAGRWGICWLNPVGWVWILFIWVFVAAVKKWPVFGLFLCAFLFSNRK